MEGLSVCYATVEEVHNGTATIMIPATRVVMGLRTTLTDLDPEVEQAMLGGVDVKEAPADVAPAVQEVNEAPVTDEPVSLREMDLSSDVVDKDVPSE
jgi:hypothetical protein